MRTKRRRLSIGHWIVFGAVYIVVQLVGHAASGELTPLRAKIIVVSGLFFGLVMSLLRPWQERIDAKIKSRFSR